MSNKRHQRGKIKKRNQKKPGKPVWHQNEPGRKGEKGRKGARGAGWANLS